MDENDTPTEHPLPQTGGAWVRMPDGRLVREGEPADEPAAPAADTPTAEGDPA